MKQGLKLFFSLVILTAGLSGVVYADTGAESPYAFSVESGKRLIWDNESNSGLVYPAGFQFDRDFLPVGLSIQSAELQVQLIPQSFPDQKESFWNFAYYSTSRFQDTAELLNLQANTTICNDSRVYHVSYEREPLLHERDGFRYHSLFFIERGSFQGDLLIVRSRAPIPAESALAYYQKGAPSAAGLTSPSDRVRFPISNDIAPSTSLLGDGDTFSDQDPDHLIWGLFDPRVPSSMSQVQNLEAALEADFDILLRYTSFNDSFYLLKEDMAKAKATGKILELTLQTNEGNGLNSSVYKVLAGDYDDQIRELAGIVRDQEDPVLFRLNNEMNGDWCNYSALHYGLETQLYRDVWTWIYQVFEEEGVDNARWVFNPNERSFPNYRWNHMLAYMPDSNLVDVIGLTGYNTGTYYPGESWRSFSEIYAPLYREYTQIFDYPFLITEFSSSSVGGDKEAWIQDMFTSLKDFPDLQGLIWWNYADFDPKGRIARPYYIDESPEVINAFKAGFKEIQSE
jgi:hypothetical protein